MSQFLHDTEIARYIFHHGIGARKAATQTVHGGATPNDATQEAAHNKPGRPPVRTNGVQQPTQQVLPATGPA